MSAKTIKLALVAIISIYIGLCLFSFAHHGNSALSGGFDSFGNDDAKYLRSAWTLLETGRYTYRYTDEDTVYIMPGLTTVLAAFAAVFGRYPILPFKIFQMILGAVSIFMVFLLTKKLISPVSGLCAALISAVYAPNIYAANVILTEACFCFLFTALLLLTLYAVESAQMKYYAAGGAVLGLAALFRPVVIMFPLVVLVMWIIRKYKFRGMIKFSATAALIACTVLSPWIIRNYMLFGKFIPLTLSMGNPALQGSFINYDQSVKAEEKIDYHGIIEKNTNINIDMSLFDKSEAVTNAVETEMLKIRFERVISKEPLKYLHWYTIGKSIKNWESPFLWTDLFGISMQVWEAQHIVILSLGIFGFVLFMFRKNRSSLLWLPILTALFFNCAHLPYYCFSRYMLPVMICPIIFASGSISAWLPPPNGKPRY